MAPAPFLLDNPVQNYAWGSRTAIAELLGRPLPAAEAEAELWIGAHPRAPSRICDPPGLGTLAAAIEADPVGLLGPDVCERFGNELPFLLKVLAAAEPLSIQAHPNREQARRGWHRENDEGIPLDAPRRNYRDPNHKPELVCALSSFVALKGFRPPADIASGLAPVAGPELRLEVGRLDRERTSAALRALFTRLMTLEEEEREALIQRALAEADRRGRREPAWEWVTRLHARYPGDIGVLAPLYLNLVTLAGEEALFLPAGELHTYLEGTAVEIMANSDNVLRGGLTPKHIDVPELLAVLTFEGRPPEVLHPQAAGRSETVFRTPTEEFELGLLRVSRDGPHVSPPGRGVEILLGLEGEAVLRATGRDLPLGRGSAVFVPATTRSYAIEGEARLVRARVPS
jgi:mannose-6-phosphate isomerase